MSYNQNIDGVDVQDINVGKLDYIVVSGSVYKVARDSYDGDPYLIEFNDIPKAYRDRWGMDE